MSNAMPSKVDRIDQKEGRATWLLTIFTGILAIFTAALAMASFWTIREARRASGEQLGVQTWLYLDPRSDSKELTHARKNLAEQLDPYNPENRAKMDHDILEFLEDVGSLYNRNLLNKELARSSCSWEAIRWWEVAKVYIADERRAHNDESLYREFEAFAKTMEKYESRLSETDLKDFLVEEKTLETD